MTLQASASTYIYCPFNLCVYWDGHNSGLCSLSSRFYKTTEKALVQPVQLWDRNTVWSRSSLASPKKKSAWTITNPKSASLTHVGYSQRLPVNLDPFFSAWLLILILFVPSEEAHWALSISSLFDPFLGNGNVTQALLTRVPQFPSLWARCFNTVCSAWSTQTLRYLQSSVQPFQVTPSWIHLNISTFFECPYSIMRCKCNSVNLQAVPELQADRHHPVKEDNN